MLMYIEQSSIYIQQIPPAPPHPQPRKCGIEDVASARPWSYDLRLTGFSECTIHNSYGQAVPAFGRFVLRFVTVRSVTINVLSPRRVTSARACFFLFLSSILVSCARRSCLCPGAIMSDRLSGGNPRFSSLVHTYCIAPTIAHAMLGRSLIKTPHASRRIPAG